MIIKNSNENKKSKSKTRSTKTDLVNFDLSMDIDIYDKKGNFYISTSVENQDCKISMSTDENFLLETIEPYPEVLPGYQVAIKKSLKDEKLIFIILKKEDDSKFYLQFIGFNALNFDSFSSTNIFLNGERNVTSNSLNSKKEIYQELASKASNHTLILKDINPNIEVGAEKYINIGINDEDFPDNVFKNIWVNKISNKNSGYNFSEEIVDTTLGLQENIKTNIISESNIAQISSIYNIKNSILETLLKFNFNFDIVSNPDGVGPFKYLVKPRNSWKIDSLQDDIIYYDEPEITHDITSINVKEAYSFNTDSSVNINDVKQAFIKKLNNPLDELIKDYSNNFLFYKAYDATNGFYKNKVKSYLFSEDKINNIIYPIKNKCIEFTRTYDVELEPFELKKIAFFGNIQLLDSEDSSKGVKIYYRCRNDFVNTENIDTSTNLFLNSKLVLMDNTTKELKYYTPDFSNAETEGAVCNIPIEDIANKYNRVFITDENNTFFQSIYEVNSSYPEEYYKNQFTTIYFGETANKLLVYKDDNLSVDYSTSHKIIETEDNVIAEFYFYSSDLTSPVRAYDLTQLSSNMISVAEDLGNGDFKVNIQITKEEYESWTENKVFFISNDGTPYLSNTSSSIGQPVIFPNTLSIDSFFIDNSYLNNDEPNFIFTETSESLEDIIDKEFKLNKEYFNVSFEVAANINNENFMLDKLVLLDEVEYKNSKGVIEKGIISSLEYRKNSIVVTLGFDYDEILNNVTYLT